MVGDIFAFFEVRLENIVVLALQQALERLNYRYLCSRLENDRNPSTKSS